MEDGSIRILDLQGNVIFEKQNIIGKTLQISTEELSKGKFILQGMDKKIKFVSKIFIIQ